MANQDETRTRDPSSGAPGAHSVGVGVGAAGGTPTGAAGGVNVGAVAGGLAGKGVAEAIDPTAEDAHWAAHYSAAPYVKPGADYKTYQPAYRYGWESFGKHPGRGFDEAEPELKRSWDQYRGASSQTWEEAKAATRDAWHRVERAVPGDADGDGR